MRWSKKNGGAIFGKSDAPKKTEYKKYKINKPRI